MFTDSVKISTYLLI